MTDSAENPEHDLVESSNDSGRIKRLALISLLLLTVSFLPRFAVMVKTAPYFDDGYWELSRNLFEHGKYRILVEQPEDSPAVPRYSIGKMFWVGTQPTALRPPSTPIFLAALRVFFGDDPEPYRLLTVILGSFVSVVLFLTACNMGHEKAGVLAGLIYAVYPPAFIISYRTFQSEPLAIYVMAVFFFLLSIGRPSSGRSVLLGLVLGVGVLNRSEFLILAAMTTLYLAVIMSYPIRYLAISWVVCVGLMAPWLVRNWVVLGSPAMTSLSGLNLWVGNNPWTYGTYDKEIFAVKRDPNVERSPQLMYVEERFPDLWDVDELTKSRYFKEVTKEYLLGLVNSNPLRLLSLYGGKLLYAIVQPGELVPFESQTYRWNPSISAFLPFVARLVLKMLCIWFLFVRKTTRTEFLLLIPMLAALVTQLIAFPLARYEVPYILGCMIFVAIKFEPYLEPIFRRNVPHVSKTA